MEILKNFIVIEGLDGSGTSTQLKFFENKFMELGIKYDCTFEPTDNLIGQLIKKVLKGKNPITHETIALLFSADRTEHINSKENGIIKNIKDGKIVVSDRYLFSSIAYQSINCNRDWVISINRFPLPEYLFFIDTPPEECIKRIKNRKIKEIYENIDFQRKAYESYLKTINSFKDTEMTVYTVDGTQPPDNIFNEIWKKIII